MLAASSKQKPDWGWSVPVWSCPVETGSCGGLDECFLALSGPVGTNCRPQLILAMSFSRSPQCSHPLMTSSRRILLGLVTWFKSSQIAFLITAVFKWTLTVLWSQSNVAHLLDCHHAGESTKISKNATARRFHVQPCQFCATKNKKHSKGTQKKTDCTSKVH